MTTNEEKIQGSLARIKGKQNKEDEKIVLSKVDLSKAEDIKVKEGAEVDLTKSKGKLPDTIDFSKLNRER
jgi:hypothetical protein